MTSSLPLPFPLLIPPLSIPSDDRRRRRPRKRPNDVPSRRPVRRAGRNETVCGRTAERQLETASELTRYSSFVTTATVTGPTDRRVEDDERYT